MILWCRLTNASIYNNQEINVLSPLSVLSAVPQHLLAIRVECRCSPSSCSCIGPAVPLDRAPALNGDDSSVCGFPSS